MGKIVVTGGCGYIGSQTIIELLKKTTYEVISIDNFCNSSPEVLERIKQITGNAIVNHNIDLCDWESVYRVFTNYNDVLGIIHFAALKSVPESVAKPVEYYKNNIESLLNITKVCSVFNIDNLIFSSSCSVYGNVSTLPVDEETTLAPVLSPYAHTKLVAEQILKFITNQSKLRCTLLRYFNPVGGDLTGLNGEDPINLASSLVPVITQTAVGLRDEMSVYGADYDTRDGSCVRDYVHVIDIADAHVKAFERLVQNRNKSNYEIYNLGTGKGVTVLEAIKTFEGLTGLKLNYKISPRRDGDVAAIYSNSTKAKEELGWEPQYSIKEMIDSAWKWQVFLKGNLKLKN